MEEKKKSFVAINFIDCKDHYRGRFEELFGSRAKAIDRMPGFINMEVLKPIDGKGEYLIMSHWDSEEAFKNWTTSPEFIEGHRSGFEDLRIAKEKGEELPMKSDFRTYKVIAD